MKYKEYVKNYLSEAFNLGDDIQLGDGKDLNITIQISKPDKNSDYEFNKDSDTIFDDNEDSTGKQNFNYDDDLENLYKIEKSISIILASCAEFQAIQTYNSVVDPNKEELNITVTTKEDENGITELFYNCLKQYNERINKISGFKFEVVEAPEIIMGGNTINGKNKNVTIIKVYKGGK